jgi:hypothetical protein
MKKVLIVSYMFPPIAGAGTQRPLKFVKYLPDYGIIVFCPQKAYWKAFDESLLDLPFVKKTKIYRCGVRRLRRYYKLRYKKGYKTHPLYYLMGLKSLCFLDFFSSWYFECRLKALEVIKEEKVDCIMTTSPPHSIHFFGLFLKKMANIPWIMDTRDAIVGDPNRPSTLISRIQDPLRYLHEKRFFLASDAIISVSDPIIASIGKRHRTQKLDAKLWTITNGFDDDDFTAVKEKENIGRFFTITYTGSFMGRRSPEFFLKAVRLLVEQKAIESTDILVRFVGHFNYQTLALFNKFKSNFPIEVLDFQPYTEALRYQINSILLLLIVNVEEDEGGSQIMTGKFFEYLGANRPILALVPRGDLKNLIIKGRFGVTALQKDVQAIAHTLRKLYDEWKSNGTLKFEPDIDLRNSFTRRNLTVRLAEIIDNIT